jgi:hypothetical protein
VTNLLSIPPRRASAIRSPTASLSPACGPRTRPPLRRRRLPAPPCSSGLHGSDGVHLEYVVLKADPAPVKSRESVPTEPCHAPRHDQSVRALRKQRKGPAPTASSTTTTAIASSPATRPTRIPMRTATPVTGRHGHWPRPRHDRRRRLFRGRRRLTTRNRRPTPDAFDVVGDEVDQNRDGMDGIDGGRRPVRRRSAVAATTPRPRSTPAQPRSGTTDGTRTATANRIWTPTTTGKAAPTTTVTIATTWTPR